ncbi:hypothetical protein GDO78_012146 [Eleutherodactylus coqui]|uniref:Uncharacterized protein n=1 Tax=Eleutherodactylus coqui TaxID=57060 RepID=A0A8J6F5J3_ELECQ|nr:hypothetical protein GDO78_012146 [Eleutherodactylus coqui]
MRCRILQEYPPDTDTLLQLHLLYTFYQCNSFTASSGKEKQVRSAWRPCLWPVAFITVYIYSCYVKATHEQPVHRATCRTGLHIYIKIGLPCDTQIHFPANIYIKLVES